MLFVLSALVDISSEWTDNVSNWKEAHRHEWDDYAENSAETLGTKEPADAKRSNEWGIKIDSLFEEAVKRILWVPPKGEHSERDDLR